jgi:hypothetical protein
VVGEASFSSLPRAPLQYRGRVNYRLEVPAVGGPEAVLGFVGAWVEQPALRRIVENAGGTWPSGTLSAKLEQLHEFSGVWDFRAGAERLDIQLPSAVPYLSAVMANAAELGMTEAAEPIAATFDHALVLGGTALASIYRTRRLFELRDGGVTMNAMAALTALRHTNDKELALVRVHPDISDIVGGVTTEFDVLVNAVSHFSNERPLVRWEDNANPNLASAEAYVGEMLVIAAPSVDATRRPNTRDNYDAYAERINPGDSVLVVTSSVYLPYQFFVALQALGWQEARVIEAVGFPPEWMDGVLTGPENVLQELRSAFLGALNTVKLLEAQ